MWRGLQHYIFVDGESHLTFMELGMAAIGFAKWFSLTRKKPHVDYSLSARLKRRYRYFCQYLSARAKYKTVERILPIVYESFQHPWVAGAEVSLRFSGGQEHKADSDRSMSWDAPITVSVFRKRRGKRRRALCMSLYSSKRLRSYHANARSLQNGRSTGTSMLAKDVHGSVPTTCSSRRAQRSAGI